MCGRFTLRTPPADLARFFHLLRTPSLQPRYNIAPSQPVAAIRRSDGGRQLDLLHWGLIPSWADDPKVGYRMINARAETIAKRPAFRAAFRRRRCLIPADGFYEWKKTAGKTKRPYYVHHRDDRQEALGGRPFAFAGLWEHFTGDDGTEIESCTIVTTDANDLLRDIHDRMPVILAEDAYERWLDPDTEADELLGLLVPYRSELLETYRVSTVVNSPRNETPRCIEPAEEQDSLFEGD